jgi:hypothetical protein
MYLPWRFLAEIRASIAIGDASGKRSFQTGADD